jgi:Na+-driven multidrug efflux pump
VAWVVSFGIALFIVGILYLMMRKPGPPLMSHALVIPVGTSVLLIVAFTLMYFGVQASDGGTVEAIGDEFSVEALKTTSTLLGVGIVTGVVAGAILGVVQRWHDYEK